MDVSNIFVLKQSIVNIIRVVSHIWKLNNKHGFEVFEKKHFVAHKCIKKHLTPSTIHQYFYYNIYQMFCAKHIWILTSFARKTKIEKWRLRAENVCLFKKVVLRIMLK